MVIASVIAPALSTLDQAYQFIQEYVGFISPGVLAIFLLGILWKRATSAAALTAAILTIPLSTALKFLPVWTKGAFPDYPFLDRMSIVFVVLVVLMVLISLLDPASKLAPRIIHINPAWFRVSTGFLAGSILIVGILTALYTVFW
jgi:SSS family solute:Na+ symporter